MHRSAVLSYLRDGRKKVAFLHVPPDEFDCRYPVFDRCHWARVCVLLVIRDCEQIVRSVWHGLSPLEVEQKTAVVRESKNALDEGARKDPVKAMYWVTMSLRTGLPTLNWSHHAGATPTLLLTYGILL